MDHTNLPCLSAYTLFEAVGSGQFGKVHRAIHNKTKQEFAIKLVKTDKFNVLPKLDEFTKNEISILSSISNPNIIQFIEIIHSKTCIYFVYEYCNQGTLQNKLYEKGHLSEKQAITIFKQLLKALEELNQKRIVHRDLKPSNILSHKGTVKLCDLGFCKQLKQGEMTRTMVGSPIYMAPEALKGQEYDCQCDI